MAFVPQINDFPTTPELILRPVHPPPSPYSVDGMQQLLYRLVMLRPEFWLRFLTGPLPAAPLARLHFLSIGFLSPSEQEATLRLLWQRFNCGIAPNLDDLGPMCFFRITPQVRDEVSKDTTARVAGDGRWHKILGKKIGRDRSDGLPVAVIFRLFEGPVEAGQSLILGSWNRLFLLPMKHADRPIVRALATVGFTRETLEAARVVPPKLRRAAGNPTTDNFVDYLSQRVCAWCGTLSAYARCTACGTVYYCNRDCQRHHWHAHHKQWCWFRRCFKLHMSNGGLKE